MAMLEMVNGLPSLVYVAAALSLSVLGFLYGDPQNKDYT